MLREPDPARTYDDDKRRAWSGKAAAYAQTFAALCGHTVEPLLDAIGAVEGAAVLDVGTGTGAVAAAALARGCIVTAVDPDPEMLAMAAAAAPGAVLVDAALPRLPLPDAAFDLVAANFVLNHVGDPRAAAAEVARVVRPGGCVGATIWPRPMTPLHRLWEDVIDDAGVERPPSAALPAALDYARTPDGLAGVLRSAGLQPTAAVVHEFVHVVDPDVWWSGPARGVATVGAVLEAQPPATVDAMRRAYDERCAQHLGDDGLLHLPTAAVLVVARR